MTAFQMQPTENIHVRGTVPLTPPRQLKLEQPLTPAAHRTVVESRQTVQQILQGDDPRLMVIAGPCSIHDERLALEYAQRLHDLSRRVAEKIFLVMRVYFEKPRTTVGWKGLINDPHLNDTFDIPEGLRRARRILLRLAELGIPSATELLEPITPQYIADVITVAAIGARTTESPTHRQMASGLSMPVGYKNGTDGNIQVALDAMVAARTPHSFLGIDMDGRTCVVNTTGNPWGFLMLRGGRSGPNYSPECLADTKQRLVAAGLFPRMLVDCSHANSNKDYRLQATCWYDVLRQRVEGNTSIVGLMVESNLFPGKQDLPKDLAQLKYGVSITDGCIGWEETQGLIRKAYEA
jgi:3-deoxy-7-phosphoheptulonate synthase